MANVQNLRKILWSQGHPERRLKINKNPTKEQEAIAIADAVVDGRVAKLQGHQLPTIQYTITLSHICNELISVGHLHIHRNDDRNVSVLDNIIRHQRRAPLHQFLNDWDETREPSWQKTSLVLVEQVNKPMGRSRGAAARRTLGLFKWLGHENNLAKMYNKHLKRQIIIAKCSQEAQQNYMIDCTYKDFPSYVAVLVWFKM
jgi:hypothetical protein